MTERIPFQGWSELVRRDRTHHRAPDLMVDMGGRSSRFHMNFGVRLGEHGLDHQWRGVQIRIGPTYYGTRPGTAWSPISCPLTTKRNYTDVLPSRLNFVLDVTELQKIRFGAHASSAAAGSVFAGLAIPYNLRAVPTTRSTAMPASSRWGFAGNPNLDPIVPRELLCIVRELFRRPGRRGTVAGFYKQVETSLKPENIATSSKDDFGAHQQCDEPVNAGSGRIYGTRGRRPVWFGPARLPGSTASSRANYTARESRRSNDQLLRPGGPIPPGVSRDSVTGPLYFDRGFSRVASYSWRDKSSLFAGGIDLSRSAKGVRSLRALTGARCPGEL